jgi:hypothetical protein
MTLSSRDVSGDQNPYDLEAVEFLGPAFRVSVTKCEVKNVAVQVHPVAHPLLHFLSGHDGRIAEARPSVDVRRRKTRIQEILREGEPSSRSKLFLEVTNEVFGRVVGVDVVRNLVRSVVRAALDVLCSGNSNESIGALLLLRRA